MSQDISLCAWWTVYVGCVLIVSLIVYYAVCTLTKTLKSSMPPWSLRVSQSHVRLAKGCTHLGNDWYSWKISSSIIKKLSLLCLTPDCCLYWLHARSSCTIYIIFTRPKVPNYCDCSIVLHRKHHDTLWPVPYSTHGKHSLNLWERASLGLTW